MYRRPNARARDPLPFIKHNEIAVLSARCLLQDDPEFQPLPALQFRKRIPTCNLPWFNDAFPQVNSVPVFDCDQSPPISASMIARISAEVIVPA